MFTLKEQSKAIKVLVLPLCLAGFILSCNDVKTEASGSSSALKSKNANAKNENGQQTKPKLDKVLGQIGQAFKGITLYDGVYNINIKLGFVECGGDFPIKLQIPDPENGVNAPVDFMGAQIQCLGIPLPLDEMIKMLMPMLENAEAPSGEEPLLGLLNDGGVIGLTRLGPIKLAPHFPILPDILSSGPEVLKSINKSTNVTLTSNAGTTESGAAMIQVKQFDSPYTTKSGKTFPKTMVWQVSNSGFKKVMLGPHLLGSLELGLSMDPLAVPKIAFTVPVMEAGQGAFQTILEGEEDPPFFLTFLVDSIKFLKDTNLLADLKFEFAADMVRFIDGGEELKLRQKMK